MPQQQRKLTTLLTWEFIFQMIVLYEIWAKGNVNLLEIIQNILSHSTSFASESKLKSNLKAG